MVSPQQPTALSVCSGIGMLDRGWQAVTSGRTVGYVEREAFAATVLLDRMEAQAMDPAPIWCGNLEDMESAPFRGVDWILAGIPCQPWSLAGKQLGEQDERHLGHELVRLVRDVEPRFIFVENVPGFVRIGLPGLLGDLAESGFDAEWICCKASDVGAPHKRERVFVFAYANREHVREQLRGAEPGTQEALPGVDGKQGKLADTQSIGRRQGRTKSKGQQGGSNPAVSGDAMANSKVGSWSTEPNVGRVAHGVPFRADRLRALGNSIVWQQAAYALGELMRRAGFELETSTRGEGE